MNISQKLLVIVCLTVLEVSITVGATFQISKGATLHQLNSLHLKHNAAFGSLIAKAENGHPMDIPAIRLTLLDLLKQPTTAKELVGPLDRLVMTSIGTDAALELIDQDIEDVNAAIAALDAHGSHQMTTAELIPTLRRSADTLNVNSSLFEGPVTQTVCFMFKLMIPMIIVISLFNICFISYLSKSISSSIRSLIRLLKSAPVDSAAPMALNSRVSGELKELMQVAENRLRAELMNIETNKELQGLIEDRTQSLRSATAQAQASVEAKARFLANMSHEIRTPINGILCASDLVLEDLDESAPHFEFNTIIRDSAHSLLRILNDILDFSKMESGQLSLESTSFDLRRTMDQVAALMAPQAEQRGLTFKRTSNLNETNRLVKGDPTRIRQVLINLLGNSLKFTESGSVGLDVELISSTSGAQQLAVTVTDSGIGMNEEQLATLFDRFAQADESTTREYGGTGLGMSLSLELAHLMGGDLKATSQYGEGSEFRLSIPLEASTQIAAQIDKSQDLKRDFAGIRILLVEDNLVNQKIATKVLSRLGLDVVLAGNGAIALELATDDISLILMDIQMPIMDGVESCRELRKRGWSKPIVPLSANVFDEDRARYAEAGMVDFIAKPMEMAELVRVLDRHLIGEQRAA